MKDTCWKVWKEEYLAYLQAAPITELAKRIFDFRTWIHNQMEDEPEIEGTDEFQRYTRQRPEKIEKNEKATFNPII